MVTLLSALALAVPAHTPALRADLAWRLSDPDLVPEDLAYDAARHRWLVTSVRRGGVFAVDDHGVATPWIAPAPATWGTFAIGLDSARNTLWVTTAAFPGTARYSAADSGRSELLEYDLRSGALRHRFAPTDSGTHALGDLVLGADGTVYISDGFGGAVYMLHPGAATLVPLVAPHTFRSPQTPAFTADGRQLFVPDYARGIALVDGITGAFRWLAKPDSLPLRGIDGLYRVGSDLIVVQNGPSPNRIVRLAIAGDTAIVGAEILAIGGDATDVNHALVREHDLYFLSRVGWDRIAANGAYTPAPPAEAPALRRIRLAN